MNLTGTLQMPDAAGTNAFLKGTEGYCVTYSMHDSVR